jgi:hypothetical protein
VFILEVNDIARYTIKDTVFCNLFSDKKYLFQLYKALHPENTDVSENDIEPITLEAVLMADIYNDVGFKVKNDIFILVEAQSTWSVNIIVRIFMYLAETYRNYFKETKQSLYSSKKVDFPKPELYVIYTGKRGDKKDFITLSEEFFNGENCSLDVRVKVIFDGEKGDIINQYVEFTKIYQEQVKLYERTRKAVLETIRICKDKAVLKEYLEKRESEVVTIMMTLFDKEYVFKTYVESEKRESEARGEARGKIIGKLMGSIETMVETCQEFGVSFSDTVKRIVNKFGISQEEAEKRVRELWK